ncbi:MAG: redox-regulated ATPase YchF, partial [Candidatus Adiutrix sp.]
MKAGIIGWPLSGRDTIFSALTGLPRPPFGSVEVRKGEALVPDLRLDKLSAAFNPKKHTPARLDFIMPHPQGPPLEALKLSLEKVREAEVLLVIVPNFTSSHGNGQNPAKDMAAIESELVLSDYVVVEKRLERLAD